MVTGGTNVSAENLFQTPWDLVNIWGLVYIVVFQENKRKC